MKTLKEILKKQEEEFDIKFNEVLNRMHNLEIVPNIQMKVNERIPQGGIRLFKSEELKAWHNKAVVEALDAIFEEVIGEEEHNPNDLMVEVNIYAVRDKLRDEIRARYTTLKKELENND